MMSDSLAPTPPMGWSSWNGFGSNIHEELIKGIADAMLTSGMKDAGYTYVNIDDHWHGGRGEDGKLFPDPQKFPSGMKALGDYIHSKGLKFGIYSDAGPKTCGGQPASRDHEEIDAQTFAAWGVDYLKYDYCHAPEDRASAERLYKTMGDALKATGRPIVFSICEWGQRRPWLWGRQAGGRLWRTTGDIGDSWSDSPCRWGFVLPGIDRIGFDFQRGLEQYAGPDGWNDPDMMIVGLKCKGFIPGGGCTDEEYRTHFSLWCLLAAPLMASCDLRSMDAVTREILTNTEVIALNQDPLGKQAGWVGAGEVWAKPLANGDLGVGLFNRSNDRTWVNAHWSNLGITGSYQVRDLWQHADLGLFDDKFSAEIAPHACVILRLSPRK